MKRRERLGFLALSLFVSLFQPLHHLVHLPRQMAIHLILGYLIQSRYRLPQYP